MAVETILRDVRYALRGLRRQPGTTALAISALAIGIGVNATVFTGHKAVFDRPLHARHPSEMVNIAIRDRAGATGSAVSHRDYEAYRDAARSFSGLVAYRLERMTVAGLDRVANGDGVVLPSSDHSEFTNAAEVSDNYFAVLGISMLRGRAFDGLTDTLHEAPPVLISENYWQRRLGAASSVVGSTVQLNGVSVVVVGITPHDFAGTAIGVPNFWVPISATPIVHGDDEWLREHDAARYRLFGRLAPGVDRTRAQAELTVLANRLRQTRTGGMDDAQSVRAVVWPGSPFPLPLNDYKGLTIAVRLILLAAALVLVVACANVGALQLARAQSRQRELQARVALGATRRRVLQQLLTESLVMSLLAGAVAFSFTWALLKTTVLIVGRMLPVEQGAFIFDVAPDLRLFAYVFAASSLAGLVFGVAPAIELARAALVPVVRGSTTTARGRRIQDALVATQVALSLALLIVGGALIHGSMRIAQGAPGYDSTHVVAIDLQFAEGARYPATQKQAVLREVQRRLEALPGVTHVINAVPPTANGAEGAVVPIENTMASTAARMHYRRVGADYFSALGIPVLRGRGLPHTRSATGSAVLSQSAADAFWPAGDAVGRAFRLDSTSEPSAAIASAPGAIYQVVGVVGDTQSSAIGGIGVSQIYLERPDSLIPDPSFLARTAGDASRAVHAIDAAISSVDSNVVITLATLEELRRLAPPFFISATAGTIASIVGSLGLLLTLMGIHSTVRYVVTLRTREIGIRMTLGAPKSDVLHLVLYEGTRPVLVGLATGVSLAIAMTWLLHRVIDGLAAFDGVSIATVSGLFLAISTFAAYVPARRALSVDPNVALRSE